MNAFWCNYNSVVRVDLQCPTEKGPCGHATRTSVGEVLHCSLEMIMYMVGLTGFSLDTEVHGVP